MVANIFEPQNMFHQVQGGVYSGMAGVIITTSDNAATGTFVTAETVDWSVAASTDGMVFDYTYTGQTYSDNAAGCAVPHADIQWADATDWLERGRDRYGRAETLLKRHLTPKQWLDYEEHGYFFLKTKKGHHYQIGSSGIQNVVRLNKRKKPMRVLCVTVYDVDVPVADIMLAQKLLLETQEDAFLKIADHWSVSAAQGIRRAA